MLNTVTLVGRVGKDPVIKNFENGSIAEFSLATTEKYKNKQEEWVDETQWHQVKVKKKYNVERCEKYVHKGATILVEGKIKYRKYDDKDGNTKHITEIIAERILTFEKRDHETHPDTTTTPDETATTNPVDDDLPF